MGRLSAILNEKMSPENLGDLTNTKKYSGIGNLFKFMLVLDSGHPFFKNTKSTIVLSALADLPDQESVNKLAKVFRAVLSRLKAGKAVDKETKKKYFKLVYTLLKDLLDDKLTIKEAGFINIFSTRSDKTADLQRKAAIMIGRSIIKKIQEIDDTSTVDPDDIHLITGYIAGLEEMDQSEAEVEKPQVNARDQFVNSEKSTEELTTLVNQISETRKPLEAFSEKLKVESEILSDFLKSNETAETFKSEIVLLKDGEESKSKISLQLENLYNQVKESEGIEKANMVTKFATDVFKRLSETIPGILDGRKDDTTVLYESDAEFGGKSITINMGDPRYQPDEVRFNMKRVFIDNPDGTITVHNKALLLPERFQGTDVNKKMFADAISLYRSTNVKKVELVANVDVGGYAWFRYGFIPKDINEVDGIARWIIDVLKITAHSAIQYPENAYDLAEFIKSNTRHETKETAAFVDYIRGATSDKNFSENLFSFSENLAAQFKKKYNNPETFYNMFEAIGIDNFDPVNINGTDMSISYKALLSIQSAKSEGFEIVPMNSFLGNTFLAWNGVLHMDRLENTEKYLMATSRGEQK